MQQSSIHSPDGLRYKGKRAGDTILLGNSGSNSMMTEKEKERQKERNEQDEAVNLDGSRHSSSSGATHRCIGIVIRSKNSGGSGSISRS